MKKSRRVRTAFCNKNRFPRGNKINDKTDRRSRIKIDKVVFVDKGGCMPRNRRFFFAPALRSCGIRVVARRKKHTFAIALQKYFGNFAGRRKSGQCASYCRFLRFKRLRKFLHRCSRFVPILWKYFIQSFFQIPVLPPLSVTRFLMRK